MNGHVEFRKSENDYAIMGESPFSKYSTHYAYTAAANAMKMMGELLMILVRVSLQY
jgi:hypothetical protein